MVNLSSVYIDFHILNVIGQVKSKQNHDARVTP